MGEQTIGRHQRTNSHKFGGEIPTPESPDDNVSGGMGTKIHTGAHRVETEGCRRADKCTIYSRSE